MKVIITKRFEKEYLKKLSKYLTKINLVETLKNKEHKFISLHEPFLKFKNKINLVEFRWVLAVKDNSNIIPLFIFLKKDKKFWENVSWETQEKMIELEFELNVLDLENWNYEIF